MGDDFQEQTLHARPIRDLGLTIEGTPLEPILAKFTRELDALEIRVRPRFYLSTEWGVPFDTIAMGLPFYLARPELRELHREKYGFVEGVTEQDILRYLRHEMGHVVNYAYRLYDEKEWVDRFGAITQPYLEEYTPQPFSQKYVRHLPGWYAQKHPDEDWAETFAVWMTPGGDWRAAYAKAPAVLAKLDYCDRALAAVKAKEPIVTDAELDEDVGEIDETLEQFYAGDEEKEEMPPGLDGALRNIFDDDLAPRAAGEPVISAATLLDRLSTELLANVFRWTGHFPEKTRVLVRHLRRRAHELGLTYGRDQEAAAVVAVTTLMTALAMNHIRHGSYLPQ
jgi:hypothetical protein